VRAVSRSTGNSEWWKRLSAPAPVETTVI
jgi:hypothetical protein